MRSLVETISQKALEKYPYKASDVLNNPDLHEEWIKLWFNTAEKLKQEMLDEGLPVTAETIQKIIDEQREFTKCTTQA